MSGRVVVVGGGLVGLCTAFALSEQGAEVVVLDRGNVGSGAARGNAGYICPSQLGPLASPTALKEAARNVGRPLAPVYLRPAAIPSLAGWLTRFVKASRPAQVVRARTALAELDRLSVDALASLEDAGADLRGRQGIVVVHHERAAAERAAAAYGVSDVLTGAALSAVAPTVARPDHMHGALLTRDRSIHPSRFVDSLAALLVERGVRFLTDRPFEWFDAGGGRVRAVSVGGERVAGDWFVLAAGAGTAAAARRLGIHLPLIGGKGYSFTVTPFAAVPHSVLFEDEHVACTPLDGELRVAGTMELGGADGVIDERRVLGIVRSARSLLRDVDLDQRRDLWVGPRPVTADGLPVLGRPAGWENLVIGTGHGMYGVTLAPATGVVLADLLLRGRSPVDIGALSPDRF